MEKLFARDYRRIAEEKCQVFSNRLAIIWLIYLLLTGLLGTFSFDVGEYQGIKISVDFSWVFTLVIGGPFAAAIAHISKKTYLREESQIEELFDGFKDFKNNFVLYLLQQLFIILWSLLLIIPGIMKSYGYAMAFFIKEDNPNLSASECLKRSEDLMNGHKWELFCLEISYFGWLLLCVITFGILSLWVGPKMEVAKYAFYRNLIGEEKKAYEEFFEEDYTFEFRE